jgi:NAD+ synthase (glutamine-hydrolysing)
VRVALAQINATVGDLDGNARLIEAAARAAHAQGAALVLTPELALTGYPPEDLLLRPAFLAESARVLQALVGRGRAIQRRFGAAGRAGGRHLRQA